MVATWWSEPGLPRRTGYLTSPQVSTTSRSARRLDDVAFQIDPLTLDGGTSYTVFAIGSLATARFTVLPAVDASLMADDMGRGVPRGDDMAAESPAA